jgi:hypothetical protein
MILASASPTFITAGGGFTLAATGSGFVPVPASDTLVAGFTAGNGESNESFSCHKTMSAGVPAPFRRIIVETGMTKDRLALRAGFCFPFSEDAQKMFLAISDLTHNHSDGRVV